MTYQIPQQLEYKEKIMFGLTFRQIIYASIFGLLGILFFRQNLPQAIKIFFIAITALFGTGFMFFDFEKHLREYTAFFKFRKVSKGDPKLAEFIGIKEIKDDFIVDSKGRKISVLKIKPINFSLKQKVEQDAIIFSFQRFLNSLDFPTQILMSTESIDLKDYLASLKEIKESEESEKVLDSHKAYLRKIISSDKLLNRVFYIIIPEQSNIEIQTEVCIERLISMNLGVERLGDKQLKALLVRFFQGDGKGELMKAISPMNLENNPDYLKINENLLRVVYAEGYPRAVEAGFLDKIVSALGDFNMCLHIKPYPIDRMLVDLNRELQKQQADLYSMQSKGIVNPSLEIQHKDTRNTLEDLQKGKERLFHVSLYICCKVKIEKNVKGCEEHKKIIDKLKIKLGKLEKKKYKKKGDIKKIKKIKKEINLQYRKIESLELETAKKELNLVTKKVESELNSLMIVPRVASFRMTQGFKSTAPLGIDELNAYRNIATDALSAFFPFTSQFLQVDESGIWLGVNKNKIPIIKDIFKLPNPNGLVLAQSGGGKSYFCKLLITRYLLNGTKVMVIDPQGEYRNIVNHFGGQRVDLSRESETIINPLDLMGHEYAEKRLSLMDLMQVMLGKLTEPQKSFIDKAIGEAYRKKGIVDDESTWNYKPPILKDLLHELKLLEKKAVQLDKHTLRALTNRLDMYVGGVFKFLNKHTNINFDNQFVCFDIGNLPKQVKPIMMFLVLDYVYMKMRSDLNKKILLIDESWSLLSRTEDASYIFEIVKTCRKFNMGLLLINQEVEGLLESAAGKSVLANSSYTFLLRQKPAVIDNICRTFNLSSSERSHLLTASIGEGLLIMEDDHSKLKVLASPEEHALITSPFKEEKIKKGGEHKEVNIKLDPSKGLFRRKGLNDEEIKYLLDKDYKKIKFRSILTKKVEEFLVRKRPNEGIPHAMAVFEIKRFLEDKNIKVEVYETKKPDLVFEINDKKYAFEVETGTGFWNKSRFSEKMKVLKEYDQWFFVVTNRNLVKKYRRLGETIDPRFLASTLKRLAKIPKSGSRKKGVEN